MFLIGCPWSCRIPRQAHALLRRYTPKRAASLWAFVLSFTKMLTMFQARPALPAPTCFSTVASPTAPLSRTSIRKTVAIRITVPGACSTHLHSHTLASAASEQAPVPPLDMLHGTVPATGTCYGARTEAVARTSTPIPLKYEDIPRFPPAPHCALSADPLCTVAGVT